MREIKTFDEYITLTKECMKSGLQNINCFLLPNETSNLIAKKKLYVLQNENTLQLIIKNGHYYKICFYGNKEFSFIDFPSDRPIITDIPYNKIMSEKNINFKNRLLSQKFVVNSNSSRMSLQNFSEKQLNYDPLICNLQANDIADSLKILYDNFNILEDLLYNEEEMKENINSFYTLKKDDEVIGIMEIVIDNSCGWVKKIAIKDKYKGFGFGALMENFYINRCKMLGIKTLLLYTIDDNINAQKFHKKFGFEFDGRHNCQLIYRR